MSLRRPASFSRPLNRRSRLRMEQLEQRSVMAGDVTVSLSGNVVKITGDGDLNDIIITGAPNGEITVESGSDATTINGLTDPVNVATQSDLRIVMNGGDDIVTFNGNGGDLQRDLYFDGGSGDNTFELAGGYTIGRRLTIINAAGFDTISLDEVTAADAYISNGSGGSIVTVSNSTFGTGITGLTIVNGAGGAFANDLVIDTVTIGRSLLIQNASGDATITIDGATIGEDLTIRNGPGNATITLGTSVANDIADDFFIRLGNGTNSIGITGGTVGGGVQLTGGTGGDSYIFDGVAIDENLTGQLAGGDNSVTLNAADVGLTVNITSTHGNQTFVATDGAIGGRLQVTNGNGDHLFELGTLGLLTVGQQVIIRNGKSSAAIGTTLTLEEIDVAGNFSILNGNGDHLLQVGAAGGVATIGGTLNMNSLNGDQDVSVERAVIGQDLWIQNGTATAGSSVNVGVTTAVTVGRDMRIRYGSGGSTSTVNAVTISRNFFLTAQSGDDVATLEGTLSGDLTVEGTTNFDFGLGGDTLNLGTDTSAATFLNGFVHARMGYGDDTVLVGESTIFGDSYFFEGNFGFDTITVVNDTAFDVSNAVAAGRVRGFEDVNN